MPSLPPSTFLPPPFPSSHLTFLPPPTPSSHKGFLHLRHLTIGGSPPYFGALTYSSSACLTVGSDMTSALTMQDTVADNLRNNPLISGEVMVYSGDYCKIQEIYPGISGTVIGPGLGRSKESQKWGYDISKFLVSDPKPRVILLDADALWTDNDSNIIDLYKDSIHTIIITPNFMEYTRLVKRYLPDNEGGETGENCKLILEILGVDGIILKGEIDIITTKNTQITCEVNGCNKRPGGLGDVLSGSVLVFLTWFMKYNKNECGIEVALWCGCAVVREAGRRAWGRKKRRMGAKDVLEEVGEVVEEVWPTFD
ncbi:hypothetical protein TrLO_g2044 [Triparma laevis f. longispina]|uniref:ATP-dependent (S)-NAD(P)H-hydrate dehydratase n=1 Tax=Triparma laevis f. longispina TaxID=1714387 RepID=A0A9W7FBV0_9STRA|nr:hypothetical protein TrLO_g2044 [Triparma laevis f. longispina]